MKRWVSAALMGMVTAGVVSAAPASAMADVSGGGARPVPAYLHAAADIDLAQIIVSSEPYGSEAALAAGADCVVYGWFDSADRELPTGRRVGQKELVNYVQTFHVQTRIKGEPRRLLRVLATGAEPLPDADDPLNHAYPGPLAEGAYVCFLKRIPGSDAYRLAGGWQGVYPVHNGRTIALQGEGFPQLGGLTVEELAKRVQSGARAE